MHQNRKADWAQCYSNRGPSVGPDRPPVKFETGSRKGLILCICQKMHCEPSGTVPRTVRRTKADWVPETHRF
jgi:hypothetical protein